MRPLALVALVALAAPAARAASPTVAVMPFKDLSGSGGAIGEAIRETVTTDLKELSGVRVIERGNLDKILAEQHLQGQRADLDPATAAKVGKLLGATLICGGAYQKVAPQVRLTARFIKVETGEIVGTAKVDGKATEFLKLQDKITSLLLQKAGLGQHSKKFEERSRPPVKPTLNTLELYGQSLLAENDDLKKKYLQLALAEDKDFHYAAKDLAALERRLVVYQSNADVARDKAARDARAALYTETDGSKYYMLMNQMFMGLQQSRRYRALAVEAREILKHPPKFTNPPFPGTPRPEELAGFYLFQAQQQLGDHDAALRDGERFLRENPGSMYFQSIKMQMDAIITDKKKTDEGKVALPGKIAEIPDNFRSDPCKLGFVYAEQAQYPEAKQFLRRCVDSGGSRYFEVYTVLPQLIEMDIKTADWAAARRDMAAFEKANPQMYRNIKMAYELRIPADG